MSNLGTVNHHRFDRKWIFTFPGFQLFPKIHNAPVYQISTKLGNVSFE